jgi:hypothetical protein
MQKSESSIIIRMVLSGGNPRSLTASCTSARSLRKLFRRLSAASDMRPGLPSRRGFPLAIGYQSIFWYLRLSGERVKGPGRNIYPAKTG